MAVSVRFDPSPFVRSHGRAPKGRGSWAFSFDGCDPIFSPSMTYTEARVWICNEVRKQEPLGWSRTVVVQVLS